MILQDLRYATRMLRRSPGFTAAAVLTLALGVGSNVAVFSLVRVVLLPGMPFPQPDQLVALEMFNKRTGELAPGLNWRDAADFGDQNHSFKGFGLQRFALLNFSHGGLPEALFGARVSAGLLQLLGVKPLLGRVFEDSEDHPSGPNVIVLSDSLWRRRFAADPSIVGKTIPLVGSGAQDWTVTGVMPPGFNFPLAIHTAMNPPTQQMAFWIPLGIDAHDESRAGFGGTVVARLGPGVTLDQAQADLNGLAARLSHDYPATNADRGVRVILLSDSVLGKSRPAMLIVLAATGLVVLIACANISGLLLVRAAARSRETAIRLALGASRARLVGLWAAEALLIAALGGACGVLLAATTRGLILTLVPLDLPGLERVGIDGLVLAFTAGVSALAGIFFGVAPAWQSAHSNPQAALSGARGSLGARRGWGDLLVAGEVALAVLLTIAAGLLMKSFAHLMAVDLGYRPERVLTAIIANLPQQRYPDFPSKVSFYRRVLDEVRAIPGVQSAGAAVGMPLSGNFPGSSLSIDGAPKVSDARPQAEIVPASEGYLKTIGIPILRGRQWTAQEVAAGRRLALVNEIAAARLWPGQDAIGKRLSIDAQPGHPWLEVIGVVKTTHEDAPDQPPSAAVYLPMEQGQPFIPIFLVVRTAATASGFGEPLRRAVSRVDKDQPVYLVASMQSLIDTATSRRRFATVILGIFGGLALILAAAGIYGVASYSVARRTREIGVRLALGASRANVACLILRQGLAQAGAGIALGWCAARLLTRTLASLLYGVTTTDPSIFVAVPALLLAVQLAACYLPVRRAMRTDPVAALRTE